MQDLDFNLKINPEPLHPGIVVVPTNGKGKVGVAIITGYPKNREKSLPIGEFYPENTLGLGIGQQVELEVEYVKASGLFKYKRPGTQRTLRPMTETELKNLQKAMGGPFTSKSTFCYLFINAERFNKGVIFSTTDPETPAPREGGDASDNWRVRQSGHPDGDLEGSSSQPKGPIHDTSGPGSSKGKQRQTPEKNPGPSNNKYAFLEDEHQDNHSESTDKDSTHTLSRPASPGPSEGKPELPSSSSSNPVLQGQDLPANNPATDVQVAAGDTTGKKLKRKKRKK